jgi:hypothetical protein
MASTRPRRNLATTNYEAMLNSDSGDSESDGSDSELSEDSNEGNLTLPDQVRNARVKTDRIQI